MSTEAAGDVAAIRVLRWRVGRNDGDGPDSGLVGLELEDAAGRRYAFAMPPLVAAEISERLAVQCHRLTSRKPESS